MLLEFVRRCNIHVAKYTALELSLIEVGLICDAYELLCCGMPVNLGSIFEFAIEHHIRLTNELPINFKQALLRLGHKVRQAGKQSDGYRLGGLLVDGVWSHRCKNVFYFFTI